MDGSEMATHVVSEPAILYLGTPVVLISSENEDGSANLAPMSSVFWLGWRAVLGLSAVSKTTQNMLRTRQCVLNLPSVEQVAAVNRLARLTGSDPVPAGKLARGYTYEKDKFGRAGLTPVASHTVRPPRALECPIQLEAEVVACHDLAQEPSQENPALRGAVKSFEVRIQRVHVQPHLLVAGEPNRIDPDQWRPLIMSFQKFYGLEAGQLHDSSLARIPEAMYRSPDVDRARSAALLADA